MGIEVLIVATIISGAVSAFGQFQAGKQQKQLAEYNAQVAQNNAVNAKAWGDYRSKREAEKQRYRQGLMTVQFLKSGVAIQEGDSSGLVIEEQILQDELDLAAIKAGAANEAAGFQNQASSQKFKGQAAFQQGVLNAGATAISTGASAAKANILFGEGATV